MICKNNNEDKFNHCWDNMVNAYKIKENKDL